VEPATVARDLGLHLMRFVMMEKRLPPAEVITFLRSLADALAAFVAQLEGYMAAADFPASILALLSTGESLLPLSGHLG
jgi:hypothetical protein